MSSPGPHGYNANPSKETFRSMTSTVPPRDWTDIHWPDIAATAPARWIAVLPLAATEQHGPHLPLGTDVMIAQAYLARVRELLPDVIPATFLPVQPVGISTEHIGYPGTLTLPAEMALRTWMALGESVARAGIRKLVMVTSHGGNSAAMSLVAQDLRAHHGLLAVTTGWSRFGAPEGLFPAEELRHGIHGGAVETSIMLARYPQTRAQGCDRGFSLRQHRDGKRLSLAFSASAGAFRLAGAGSPLQRRCRRCDDWPQRRKASTCSITGRGRFASCSPTSINSIRKRSRPVRKADAYSAYALPFSRLYYRIIIAWI